MDPLVDLFGDQGADRPFPSRGKHVGRDPLLAEKDRHHADFPAIVLFLTVEVIAHLVHMTVPPVE